MNAGPKRLLEADSGAPSALRSLLDEAQSVRPTERQVESLASKLGPLFALDPGLSDVATLARDGAGSGATAGASAAAGGSLIAGGVKWATLLVVASGIGGGVWLANRSPEKPPPAVPAVASPKAQSAAAAPEPVDVGTPTASPAALPSQPAAAGNDERKREPTGAAGSAISEADLLERARGALNRDPAQALSLSREHAVRFPRGVLAQEREVIAIEALKRLNRSGEAKARAGDFKKHYPDSAHQRKLDALDEK